MSHQTVPVAVGEHADGVRPPDDPACAVSDTFLHRTASFIDRHLPHLGFVATVCSALVLLCLGLWICLAGSLEVRGVEVNVVFTIQKALRGVPVYTDPADLPFDFTEYSPWYYLVCAGLGKAFGVSSGDPARVLLLARGVSLLITVLTAALSFYLMRAILGVQPSLAVAACAFALAATSPWQFLARPDALMGLLMLASYTAALASSRSPGRRAYALLLLASLLACAAAFTKQNGAQAVVILLTYLLFTGQFRRFVFTLMATAVIAGTIYQASVWVWPSLFTNISGVVQEGISLPNAFAKTYGVFFSNFAFPLGLVICALLRWARPGRDDREAFFLVSLPFLFLFATGTGLKIASAENYYNDFLIIGSAAIAFFIQGCGTKVAASSTALTRGGVVKLLSAYLICLLPVWTVSQLGKYWWTAIDPKVSYTVPGQSFRSPDYQEVAQQLRTLLAQDPDALVLSFDVPFNNVLPERCIVPQKEVAAPLFHRKVVDYSRFHQYLAAGRVKYLVTNGDPPPGSFLGARFDRFAPTRRIGEYTIYEYRGS
jgi:hypothetical protein